MGVYRSEPQTTKKIKQGENNQMKFISGEMQGWRKNMQDADICQIDIGDGNSLFAVFDGHGGPEVSVYVSQIFINILKERKEYKQKQFVQALDITFKIVDEMIDSEEGNIELQKIRKRLENNQTKKISSGTGCTANVILITQTQYIIANSGDSRSALLRDGKLVVFSQDHKPENPIETQRITKAGGQIQMGRVNGGLNLSRSFGDFDYKRNQSFGYHQQMITCKPDIKVVKRQKEDDFIVSGCDGIWQRYVENSQGLLDLVKSQIKNQKEGKKIIQDILQMLLAKDTRQGIGCDNMTIILIILK